MWVSDRPCGAWFLGHRLQSLREEGLTARTRACGADSQWPGAQCKPPALLSSESHHQPNMIQPDSRVHALELDNLDRYGLQGHSTEQPAME